MSYEEEEATLSLPSIAIVAVIGFIIYRFFFTPGSGASSGTSGSSSSRDGVRYTRAQVDQVSQMFPHLSRRQIMWDLQRNRGSVQATIERVLSGSGVSNPPASFQPVEDPNENSSAAPSPSVPLTNVLRGMKIEPDLITRYGLQSRIVDAKGKGKERETETESESASVTGWANTKEQRQSMLQRRRDEMILAARRKMQEKDSQLPAPSSQPLAPL